MSPSKRFKPVQMIASNKERKAATALGDSLKSKRAAADKLSELKRYHAEYMERFENSTRAGIGAGQLQEYRAFLRKLELAISEQEKVVAMAELECDNRKDHWRGHYTKSQAVNNVVTRLQDQEKREADRKEQAISDEFAQRKR